MKLMMFVKHLQTLPIEQSAAAMRELGFEGMDLTVRASGVVKPKDVRTELVRVVKILESHGLQVPLITTDVLRADDDAIAVFETAASLNIREIKLGYHKYEKFGTFHQTLHQMHHDLDSIEALAKKLKIRANLHIHSNDHMTAQPAIVWDLIRARDPAAIGAYVDPGHMFTEGGRDGWRQGLDLLGDRITLVAIKDVSWERVPLPSSPGTPGEGRGEGSRSVRDLLIEAQSVKPSPNPSTSRSPRTMEHQEREPETKPRWDVRVVPLSKGIVQWPAVFDCLRQLKFDGWLSIHSEYKELDAKHVLEQTRADLGYLRQAVDLW